MEIALFGGTFNPPTKAHQDITSACAELPYIDEVWLMPSNQRLDKHFDISDCHRIEMLEAVVGEIVSNKIIRIENIELNMRGYTHTSDTVRMVSQKYPNDSFWYVYGVDSYESMGNWAQGQQLKDNLQMILVPRAGHAMPEETERVRHLEVPNIVEMDLSSTKVRAKIAKSESIAGLVCQGVESVIKQRSLYI